VVRTVPARGLLDPMHGGRERQRWAPVTARAGFVGAGDPREGSAKDVRRSNSAWDGSIQGSVAPPADSEIPWPAIGRTGAHEGFVFARAPARIARAFAYLRGGAAEGELDES
jgi:hypothetical protein